MPEPSSREWRFHLDGMIAFASRMLAYTHRFGHAGFVASSPASLMTPRCAIST